MMVTAFAMDVAMRNFFFAGITHADNLDLEVQALASQWVVAVNDYVVAFQLTDGHDLHAAIRTGGVELHAHFQLVDAFQRASAARLRAISVSQRSPFARSLSLS